MSKKQDSLPRRLVVVFDGHVQGIGFRFTTVEIAREHRIEGYVQNMIDGSVKVVAEGLESDLLRFLDAVRASHVFRYVTREDLLWHIATGDLGPFSIRYI